MEQEGLYLKSSRGVKVGVEAVLHEPHLFQEGSQQEVVVVEVVEVVEVVAFYYTKEVVGAELEGF